MKPKYFGTDGIRGLAFKELTAELAFRLGNSLKEVLDSDEVVIGLDTRESSEMLGYMVAAGAMQAGMDVKFAGVIQTPAIAHYAKLKSITGIMVTASHNKYHDNGIKVFNKGNKSLISEELIIEQYIDGVKHKFSDKYGSISLTDDVKIEYIKLIDKLKLINSQVRLVYDSANGANHKIANEIISKYYYNSKQIGNEPNGLNINKDVGSTALETIKKYILDNNMDLGVAFDGDGDRVILLDNDGTIYDGDFIILLVAKYLKKQNMLKNNGVVLTKMSNPGILKALRDNNINYVLTEVGDKNVYEAMLKYDYILGGEASGHIIINHILHSGDGLLAALYVLKLIEEEKTSLKALTSEVKLYPFKMVNIKNINKNVLEEAPVKDFLAQQKSSFKENDIFYIRPSGTEPLIRVTISCEDENKLNRYMDETVKFIREKGEMK